MKKSWKHIEKTFKALPSWCRKAIQNNFSVIIIVILFLAGWLSPVEVPNFLNITNITGAVTTSVIIAGSLAAILGIVVAILLVVLEVLRRTYASYALKEFFQSKQLKRLFVLYISTILISTVGVANVKEPLSSRNINILYLSMALFVTCMIILYPHFRTILFSTGSKRRIRKIAAMINYQDVWSLTRRHAQTPASDYISAIEENPIFVLSEVAIRTIKEGDRITPKVVLMESTQKLLSMIGEIDNAQEKRGFINAFSIIIRNSAKQAILERQGGTLRTVLDIIEDVHTYSAANKLPYYTLYEIDELLGEILKEAIQSDFDEIAREGMWLIKRVAQKHLKANVPEESEIYLLQIRKDRKTDVPHDTDKDLQWEHVSSAYIGMLGRLTEEAIELKKGYLAATGMRCFPSLASEINNYGLGPLQKEDIVRWCYYYAKKLTLKCADEGLYGKVLMLSPFEASSINRILEKRADFSKEPLLAFGETLVQLAQKTPLDRYTLNNLGAIGRGCVNKVDNGNIFTEALLYICRVFDKIREILETENIPENRNAYVEASQQVKSLVKWFESKDKHNKRIEEELAKVIGNFNKRLQDFGTLYKSKTVKWPADEKSKKVAADDYRTVEGEGKPGEGRAKGKGD